MHATAISKIVSSIGTTMKNMLIKVDILMIALPSKDINRWPAIRLAVSRTDSVIGRIRFLTSSINTMNIIRGPGVPCGTRWDSIMFVFLIQPNIIKLNQNVKEIGKLIRMWEVKEKTWGYKATMLTEIINTNKVIISNSRPFSFDWNVNLTSFLKVLTIFL